MPDPTDVNALVDYWTPTLIAHYREFLTRPKPDGSWWQDFGTRCLDSIEQFADLARKAEQLERERDEAREAVVAAQDYINNILGCPSPDFIATVVAREAVKGAK